VQVDPIKPTLKAPKTKRLKIKYDQLLSNFGIKFNLCRYNLERMEECALRIQSNWRGRQLRRKAGAIHN
jgi:hypothetical protein